jgi:hypothetical protein
MRRGVILAEAAEDLEQGRNFYDAQESGIGDYFADSLVADIESLAIYHGIHARQFGCYRMRLTDFHSAFTIGKPRRKPRCSPFWICEVTQTGFAKN